MGIYSRYVLPRVVDRTCGASYTEPYRQRVCADLRGRVAEIGFGSGLNVAWYPAAVTEVAAVEPSDLAWRLAAERVSASPVAIRRLGLVAERLPFADGSVDAVLSTWTMCTIPDLAAALADLRRVLRPGGTLHLVEHGLAPEAGVVRWQRRLEPLQKRLAGGCHLTRPIRALVEGAGFAFERVETFYLDGAPRPLGFCTLGVAAAV